MDLTQEVFIKVISSIEKYKNKGKFKSWLFTIAANHLKNHWRYHNLHSEYSLKEDTEREAEKDNTTRIDVRQALLHIPVQQKEVIVLMYYYGFTAKEIARIISEKESTVKARIRYGLQKMEKLLKR